MNNAAASHRVAPRIAAQRLPASAPNSKRKTNPKDEDITSRFGKRVRSIRLARDMSQTDMSRYLQIDRSYISDLERGRKSIRLPMIEVIAVGLQISLSELFRGL